MRMLAVVVVFGLILSVGCAACENCRNCRNCRDCRGETNSAIADGDRGDRSGRSDRSDGSIRIESARYGRDDEWVDVTPQVRGLIDGDTIVFPRNLHTTFNVDPVPGRMKYVDMVIIVDGRVVEMTLGDSLHVTPLRLRVGGGAGGGLGDAGAGHQE